MEEPSQSVTKNVNSRPPSVNDDVDKENVTENIYRSDVKNESVVSFDLNININNTDQSDVDADQSEKVVNKSRGHMHIPLTQIESTVKMLGKPNVLAIRSGAFLTTEYDKKELGTAELDLQFKITNKNLCYVDMIAEKPSIHEINIIFDKINRDKVIISDKEIIDTLRNPKEEKWDSRKRRASWKLGKKIEAFELPEHLQDRRIPAHLDEGAGDSIISRRIATKLNLSTFKLKKGVTIRAIDDNQSTWNEFAYVQIRLLNCMEEWQAIMLCVVMDSDETPLLIGGKDQAAYAMTP